MGFRIALKKGTDVRAAEDGTFQGSKYAALALET